MCRGGGGGWFWGGCRGVVQKKIKKKTKQNQTKTNQKTTHLHAKHKKNKKKNHPKRKTNTQKKTPPHLFLRPLLTAVPSLWCSGIPLLTSLLRHSTTLHPPLSPTFR